jgi:hypothetical protein
MQTLVLVGVIAVMFVLWERWVGDRAMVPVKIFKSRSMYGLTLAKDCNSLSYFAPTATPSLCSVSSIDFSSCFFHSQVISFSSPEYIISSSYTQYIPIFYQVARHHSATKSGIDLLPYLLAFLLTTGITGFAVSKTGY